MEANGYEPTATTPFTHAGGEKLFCKITEDMLSLEPGSLPGLYQITLNYSDRAIEVEKKHHERKSDRLFCKKSNDQRFIAYRRDRDF